jgi:hypothetical protein
MAVCDALQALNSAALSTHDQFAVFAKHVDTVTQVLTQRVIQIEGQQQLTQTPSTASSDKLPPQKAPPPLTLSRSVSPSSSPSSTPTAAQTTPKHLSPLQRTANAIQKLFASAREESSKFLHHTVHDVAKSTGACAYVCVFLVFAALWRELHGK